VRGGGFVQGTVVLAANEHTLFLEASNEGAEWRKP